MKRKANKEKMKICLVGSSGGHLTHLYMLKPFWKDNKKKSIQKQLIWEVSFRGRNNDFCNSWNS